MEAIKPKKENIMIYETIKSVLSIIFGNVTSANGESTVEVTVTEESEREFIYDEDDNEN